MVAVNKPHGLLVHRSPMAADAREFALQMLRNQLGRHVYPAHRIDRKTGGILLFALDQETEVRLRKAFAERQMDKHYLAIVRGWAPGEGEIDYALHNDSGQEQDAVTRYKRLNTCELDIPFGKHASSRYSLMELKPVTGRMHQLRKHMAHIFHPIIGDRPHGCNKQNKLFKERWDMHTMLLHAARLQFSHPYTGDTVRIVAPVQEEFARMLSLMGWESHL